MGDGVTLIPITTKSYIKDDTKLEEQDFALILEWCMCVAHDKGLGTREKFVRIITQASGYQQYSAPYICKSTH